MRDPAVPNPLEVVAPRRAAVRPVAPGIWEQVISQRLRDADRAAGTGVPSGAHGERAGLSVVPHPSQALVLDWHEREVHRALAGQYRITAPLRGGPVPRHANATLTRLLDGLWVTEPTGTGPTITSVVAIIGRSVPPDHRGRQTLTILLTADDAGDDRLVHGIGMGRQVRQALAQVMSGA